MKIIEKLADMIEEELEDAEKYAMCAHKHRDMHPELANAFHHLAQEEIKHADLLHTEVVRLIEEHRSAHGAPPANMLAVWEYVHKKHVEKAARVKSLIREYHEGV